MFQIDGPGIVGAKPARTVLGTIGWFNQSPGSSPGTVVTAEWLNMIQAEVLAVVTGAGLTPDKAVDNQLYQAIVALTGAVVPPGLIAPYGGETAPIGWLLCDGSAVDRTAYSNLFAAIGTTYGAGNGSTTFNVPDLRGRVAAGKDPTGTRLTNTTMTPDGNTLGAVGGQQTETAGVNVSVSGSISGFTGGSLSVGVTSTSMDLPNSTGSAGDTGSSTQYARNNHTHANVQSSGATSGTLAVGGSFSGSGSGGSFAVTNVQPTLILNYIIRT